MTKHKQALVLIMLVMLSWVDVSAQLLQNGVVYLRNGSIIRGEIIKQTADSLRIETNCNSLIILSQSDVLEIKSETTDSQSNIRKNDYPLNGSKGFYSYTTIGMLTGNSEVTDDFTFSFHTNIGYEFSHLIGIGVGVGVEHLKTELLPVYASFKSHLRNKPNSPFISLSVGYSFPLSETKRKDEYTDYSYDGGFGFGVDLGISSFKTKNYAFTITAGYKYQIVKETSDIYYWWYSSESKEVNTYQFNKIAVRMGFMFR
ncbi:MAG: hypothetical protein HC831_28185 [Chloroflexia bacterium]|nr:hypothetical protein [Chloroflexia bacterium]